MLKKIKLDTVVCSCFLAFGVFFFYNATKLTYWGSRYAPGPGFIPSWTGGLLIFLSLIALIQSFKENGMTLDKILPANRSSRINLYVCWGGLLFFILFVNMIGFVTTATILLTTLFSRGTNFKRAALIGFSVTLVFFFIFKIVLQVQIPTNTFGF